MEGFKKLFEKKVDERQELELMKVERAGFWIMYWMLLAVIIVEGIIMEDGAKLAAGEWLVFMTGCVVIIVGCARKGVWTYQSKKVPGVKSWLAYSLVVAVVGMILGLIIGLKWQNGNVPGVIFCMVAYAVFTFALAFVAFAVIGSITKKRESKLEAVDYDEDEE